MAGYIAPRRAVAAKRYLTRGLARLVAAARERIVRPDMLGIAAAHVGAHIGPGAAPEAGQVARRLDRPVRRRQQFQRQRHRAAGDRRMPVEAEQLLHADRQHRPFAVIADRHVASRRRVEMGRRERWRSCAADRAAPATSARRERAPGSMRAKDASPDRNGSSQSSSDASSAASDTSGQGAPSPRCSQRQALAQRLGLLAPRQQRQAVLAQRGEDRAVGLGAGRRRQHALGQARWRRAARSRGPARRASPGRRRFAVRRLDAVPSAARMSSSRDRRGGGDARVLRLALQIGDDEERLAGQRIGGVEHARRCHWRARSARARRAPWRRGPARRGGEGRRRCGIAWLARFAA